MRWILTAVAAVMLASGSLSAQTPPPAPGEGGPREKFGRMDARERKDIMDIFMRMRKIEQKIVSEDEEVRPLFNQFREKLNQKLDGNTEYQDLRKRLEEKGIRPPGHGGKERGGDPPQERRMWAPSGR